MVKVLHNKAILGAVLLLGLVVAVYVPGLDGPFLLDDRENLMALPAMKMVTLSRESVRDALFAWGEWYPHRGIARVSFALNYYFADHGFESFPFKVTNLVIHVLNGVLVYWLSVLLLRRHAVVVRPPSTQAASGAMQSYLPLLATALWLLHPIQLTGVLYVVQRMTSMAAFFVLLGLVVFVLGRSRHEAGRRFGMSLMFAGLAGGVVLGFLCKQNAVLLPFFAFLVELFFFRREALTDPAKRRLYAFYALTVGLPAVMAVAGLVFAWDTFADAYSYRDFTPWERVLTQSRVLFFYLGLIVFPHIRAFGLYHDDIVLSTGLLDPWTTLVSVLAWLVLVALALWGVRRRALWSFGLLWYLVGHALESSLISLELVYEHRNYVPSYGVLLAAAYYLVRGLERLSERIHLALPVVGALLAVLAFTTFARASNWSDKYSLIEANLRYHPNSSRTHGEFATMNDQFARDPRLAYEHWSRAAELNQSSILELMEMQKLLAREILTLSRGGESSSEHTALADPPKHFSAPLILELDYLWALDGLVASEISERLRTRPVLMDNAAALRTLEHCTRLAIPACTVLRERAIEWYSMAIDNPRLGAKVRAVLLLKLASLHLIRGEKQEAVKSVAAAVESDPDHAVYRLELAALYMQLGELEAAGRIIAEAGSDAGLSAAEARILRELERNLSRAQARIEGAAPSSR